MQTSNWNKLFALRLYKITEQKLSASSELRKEPTQTYQRLKELCFQGILMSNYKLMSAL